VCCVGSLCLFGCSDEIALMVVDAATALHINLAGHSDGDVEPEVDVTGRLTAVHPSSTRISGHAHLFSNPRATWVICTSLLPA
jgi:hypothetical protein